LQLEVIERAIELWTNPNDLVYTPFLGIGSEVYTALKMGRRGIGSELKPSYFRLAVENCKSAVADNQADLFGAAA
jgi:DNA modification methylase